jgi:Transmembrane family 220, helix
MQSFSMYRISNWVMAALFLFAVVVQYNDPDPLRWMAIYGGACGVCVAAARRGAVPRWAPLLIGFLAIAWSLEIMTGVRTLNVYAHMFDAWEMKSAPIEEAREASGLVIVAVWMIVLTLWRQTATRSGSRPEV